MARIVTVYTDWKQEFELSEMGHIRWVKVSQALAHAGHQVDIATQEPLWEQTGQVRVPMGPNLCRVPLERVRWSDYDVVKTLFHIGFTTLERYGGTTHPRIISKSGSVVAAQDAPGIYFSGAVRERLYRVQQRVHQTSHNITLLSAPAVQLWEQCHGPRDGILLVPGAADREIPPPRRDPFPVDGRPRCIFAGNVYTRESQREANVVLVDKLNRLGRLLASRGIRLCMFGKGDVSALDRDAVEYLGIILFEDTWDYFHGARVGVVVSAGPFMHNNESSKIYYYLRAGLPVVSEAGFPNDHVVTESEHGYVVENGNLELMAARIQEAVGRPWPRERAEHYILRHHTWDHRVQTYQTVLGRPAVASESRV